MNFSKSFELDKEKINIIPAFFKAQGYKLELSLPNNYRFTRGSVWLAPLTRDIKSFPTRVDVIITEKEGDKVQVLVLYDIDTMGKVVPPSQQGKIWDELNSL
jgi:hypothetical protein